MREKTYITILEWMIAIVLSAALVTAINTGIKKNERKECLKWQDWQELYPGFIVNDSMREQCDNYGIKLTELEKGDKNNE